MNTNILSQITVYVVATFMAYSLLSIPVAQAETSKNIDTLVVKTEASTTPAQKAKTHQLNQSESKHASYSSNTAQQKQMSMRLLFAALTQGK